MTEQFTPDWVSPPGDTMNDRLDELGWSQREFAERLTVSAKHANHLINGKVTVTPEMASKLELVLGGSAVFWLNRDAQYRSAIQTTERFEALREGAPEVLKRVPMKWLFDQGCVPRKTHKGQQLHEVLRFFGVASVSAFDGKAAELAPAFRKSGAFEKRMGSVFAWTRAAEVQAQEQRLGRFDVKALRDAVPAMREFVMEHNPHVFLLQLQALLNQVGVALVALPTPPKCPVHGATWWIDESRAVLALSFRHKSDDQFWFSFFHEVAHLVLHGRRRFVEGLGGDGLDEALEDEANLWAADVLIPPGSGLDAVGRSKADVQSFASKVRVPPGIVVGRLQHDGKIARRNLNGLKVRYTWVES